MFASKDFDNTEERQSKSEITLEFNEKSKKMCPASERKVKESILAAKEFDNKEEPPAISKNSLGNRLLSTSEITPKKLTKNQRKRGRRRIRLEAEKILTKEINKNTLENQIMNREVFSVQDPCTPNFLNEVVYCYYSDIKFMQMRLEEDLGKGDSNDSNIDMIVAKIVRDNDQPVAEHVFEFIRNDLVGWIGAYQQDGMDTPIFHSINNNGTHITIVCDNDYAYNCLQQCIDEISEMKTMGVLRLCRLPSITPVIYCFDAMYDGLARDPDLFLKQLHLHKPKLHTNNWIVVSHAARVEERKTYFIFLVDERSALALNFLYTRSFCICLQNVTFRIRGIAVERNLN